MAAIDHFLDAIGRRLAQRITSEAPQAGFASDYLDIYGAVIRKGDVLLVDGGTTKIATAIKYLTQSTWSHAALYVGDALGPDHDPQSLIEAEVGLGVVVSPLAKYRGRPLRICRPVGLGSEAIGRLIDFAKARIGHGYDLRNVIDLMRWLWPMPPVPGRARRRLIALGSGEPTRAICSTLIAQSFESVGYPILVDISRLDDADTSMKREMMQIRHYSLYTPRDFDVSPYFAVIKPTLELAFDYRCIPFAGRAVPEHCATCGKTVIVPPIA